MLKKTLRKLHLVRKVDGSTNPPSPPPKSKAAAPPQFPLSPPPKKPTIDDLPRTLVPRLKSLQVAHEINIRLSGEIFTPSLSKEIFGPGEFTVYDEAEVDPDQSSLKSPNYVFTQEDTHFDDTHRENSHGADSHGADSRGEFILHDSWFGDQRVEVEHQDIREQEFRSQEGYHDEYRESEEEEDEAYREPEEEEDPDATWDQGGLVSLYAQQFETIQEHPDEDAYEAGEIEEPAIKDQEDYEEEEEEVEESEVEDKTEEDDDDSEEVSPVEEHYEESPIEYHYYDPNDWSDSRLYSFLDAELEESALSSPLLNLPLEVFNMITADLPYYDILSLSLTTRRLFRLYPTPDQLPSTETYAEWRKQAICNHLILHRYLPHRIFDIPENPDMCPYCSVELCPPTCPSALLLDSKTGVFYPASLYPLGPLHPAMLQFLAPEAQSKSRFAPTDLPRLTNLRTFPKDTYTTIWCSHHRCPADLLSANFQEKSAPAGSIRFWHDHNDRYNIQWDPTKTNLNQAHTHKNASLVIKPTQDLKLIEKLVGYRTKSQTPPTPGFSSKRNTVEIPIPVHETTFYDSLCRHCRLPLPVSSSELWFGITCTCDNKARNRDHSGCSTCGAVSMKFTTIEAFEPIIYREKKQRHLKSFKLTLATEVRVEKKFVDGKLVDHLVDVFPDAARRNLDLVRYSRITPPPVQTLPRIAIPNLPDNILDLITGYLLENTRFDEAGFISKARRFLFQSKGVWDWYHDRADYCDECRDFSQQAALHRKPRSYECACDWAFYLFIMDGCDESGHYLDDYFM
ncbi:hypothetical protein TWF694_010141 [Orbilia ellipsospora]|uniref:F-box domain-containing protein n=1 Tax=Orbilia ellipsospora TaxID=2528407 RepID=A0AAV9X922_9PEZI